MSNAVSLGQESVEVPVDDLRGLVHTQLSLVYLAVCRELEAHVIDEAEYSPQNGPSFEHGVVRGFQNLLLFVQEHVDHIAVSMHLLATQTDVHDVRQDLHTTPVDHDHLLHLLALGHKLGLARRGPLAVEP